MNDSSTAVAAADLACRRGERVLFRGLNLTVQPGQIVWVRGANGQGKTSLLRLLAGLARPEAGRIEHGAGRERVYVGHANALKDDLTVAESLMFLSRLHGFDTGAAAHDLALRRFGLHTRRSAPVRTLSQGQRRRVALARLCTAPATALWLLDEPFDALDADGVDALNALLGEHAARGGSVLLTSHVPLTLTSPPPITLRLNEAAAA
ncbi:MAG: cytochrome c biogenesis heme-transporting ATPase CcmA [Burkholderiales bacterium]